MTEREKLFALLLLKWLRTEYTMLETRLIEDGLVTAIVCPLCEAFTVTDDPSAVTHKHDCLYVQTRIVVTGNDHDVRQYLEHLCSTGEASKLGAIFTREKEA